MLLQRRDGGIAGLGEVDTGRNYMSRGIPFMVSTLLHSQKKAHAQACRRMQSVASSVEVVTH